MSCHDYEGVMPVLCTPLQIKCYPTLLEQEDCLNLLYFFEGTDLLELFFF